MPHAAKALRASVSFAVLLLVLADGGVSSATGQLPSAREVVDRYVEAIGGRAAIEGHTSSHARGSVEIVGQGLTGTMEIWAAAPDSTVVNVSFPAAGIESMTGYNGEVGWSVDPMTGERLLQGGELTQLVDEADYYGDLHDAEDFLEMEVVEQSAFNGTAAYKVRLVYQSGREIFEYFDVESGLMIGQEGPQESIMGSMHVVTTLGDYRQVEDVMVPMSLEQSLSGLQTVRVSIESVEFDTVDATAFELPASIQALIR